MGFAWRAYTLGALCAPLTLYDQEAMERQQDHGKTTPGKYKTLPANLPEVKG